MPIELIILLFVTGILGGFLAGLTGVGGNMIFIPILDFVLYDCFSTSFLGFLYVL